MRLPIGYLRPARHSTAAARVAVTMGQLTCRGKDGEDALVLFGAARLQTLAHQQQWTQYMFDHASVAMALAYFGHHTRSKEGRQAHSPRYGPQKAEVLVRRPPCPTICPPRMLLRPLLQAIYHPARSLTKLRAVTSAVSDISVVMASHRYSFSWTTGNRDVLIV